VVNADQVGENSPLHQLSRSPGNSQLAQTAGYRGEVPHLATRCLDGAVAIVQERFWGMRSGVVLLTQGFFENGEEYLLDGVHSAEGPLTRFLPIVGFRPCNHSARLKDAKVDLRILRDKSPRIGVRIIGEVTRYNGKTREPAPGASVVITGPTGTLTTITDAQGIYDVAGLPPGRYDIHAEPRSSIAWGRTSDNYELKAGEVGGGVLDVSFVQ
jgi:hypothetical protein